MELRNREVGIQSDPGPRKKRKLEDGQDSTQPGRKKSGKKTPKEEPAPKEKAPRKKKVLRTIKVPRGKNREKKVLEMLRHTSPPTSDSLLEASNQDERPMPPGFQRILRRYRDQGKMSEAVEQYFLNFSSRDSRRVPGEGGPKSILGDIIKGRKTRKSGWKPLYALGRGASSVTTRWEKARQNEPAINIAIKKMVDPNPFFDDYNMEGNLIRRLNDAGCKNVIKAVDWWLVRNCYRTCLEYGDEGNLRDLIDSYKYKQYHTLPIFVFPEAFIWHVFHSIANALCYCRHGTNTVHSPLHGPGWDQIIHADLNSRNIFLTAPDEDCHRLYPSVKLADFDLSYPLNSGKSRTKLQGFWRGFHELNPTTFQAPEKSLHRRVDGPRDFEDSYSDIYSLGVLIAKMCRLVDKEGGDFGSGKTISGKPIPQSPEEDDLDSEDSHPEELMNLTPSKLNISSPYYSPQLKQLIRRCRSEGPLERPHAYGLYLETKSGMEAFRERAYLEEEQATVVANVRIYHSKLFYLNEEQDHLLHNQEFKQKLTDANLDPVRDAERLEESGVKEADQDDDTVISAEGGMHDEDDESMGDEGGDELPESEGSTPKPPDEY